jgi:hypothetical protein
MEKLVTKAQISSQSPLTLDVDVEKLGSSFPAF